jgi:hypothetical protein
MDEDNDSAEMWARVRQANKVIAIIASCGRRFFYSPAYDRTARFGLDKHGQVWFVDCHTGMKLHPFGEKNWPGFTHGQTLKDLVARLAHYITTGYQLELDRWFRLENDGAYWAYGDEAMSKVRAEVMETEVILKEHAHA